MSTTEKKNVVVLGAGVVGLTTALTLQQEGKYKVSVIAETLPNDPHTIKYTSHWAGARDVVNAEDDKVQYKHEIDTFKIMWELAKPGSDAEGCFLHITQTEYSVGDPGTDAPDESMPDYRVLERDELIPGATCGMTYSALTIDVPAYLNYLQTKFIDAGGRIIRGAVQHINQVIEGGPKIFMPGDPESPPDAVVVCVGLGARFLGGIEDKNMYPVRGQTVLVKAPWVKHGMALYYENSLDFVYIIPRSSGNVIVGGTRIADDWYPIPRPETSHKILENGLALCPELAAPEVRTGRAPTVDEVLPQVVEYGCGLRPARKGGIRLETEWTEGVGGRGKVPVIHNYGHGGGGYQMSWSSAKLVLSLVRDALGAESGKA